MAHLIRAQPPGNQPPLRLLGQRGRAQQRGRGRRRGPEVDAWRGLLGGTRCAELLLRSPKITEICFCLLGGLAPSACLSLLFPGLREVDGLVEERLLQRLLQRLPVEAEGLGEMGGAPRNSGS